MSIWIISSYALRSSKYDVPRYVYLIFISINCSTYAKCKVAVRSSCASKNTLNLEFKYHSLRIWIFHDEKFKCLNMTSESECVREMKAASVHKRNKLLTTRRKWVKQKREAFLFLQKKILLRFCLLFISLFFYRSTARHTAWWCNCRLWLISTALLLRPTEIVKQNAWNNISSHRVVLLRLKYLFIVPKFSPLPLQRNELCCHVT